MTDNELIKTLEVISDTANCHECGFYDGKVHNCAQIVAQNSLDLINRLKAENERLEQENRWYADIGKMYRESKMYSEIRAEAIKEFAKLLIDKSTGGTIFISDLPDLVKEMAGDSE